MDFSPSFNLSEFESRAWSLRAIAGTGSAVASTAIPPMSMLRRLTSTVIVFPFLILLLNNEWTRTQRSRRSGTNGTEPLGLEKVGQFRFTYRRSLAPHINQWLNQRIVGTVTTKASVETRSIDAASDSTALYLAAKSTTTVASGKLQQTSASRANGLTTCNKCSIAKRTADCTVTRAREPTNTAREKRTG